MNKLVLFLCFLLAINFSQSVVIDGVDIDDVYDKATVVAKGLAKSNEYKCYSILKSKRSAILREIVEIINDFKSGDNWTSIAGKHFLFLLINNDFTSKCRVSEIAAEAMDFITPNGIYRLGSNMVGNSQTLQTYADEFVRANNLDGKLIAAGKMLKLVTGLWVY